MGSIPKNSSYKLLLILLIDFEFVVYLRLPYIVINNKPYSQSYYRSRDCCPHHRFNVSKILTLVTRAAKFVVSDNGDILSPKTAPAIMAPAAIPAGTPND